MGGIQAYHWAALFPDCVERLAVLCGPAKTAPHNQVFLENVKATLTADVHYQDGRFMGFPERGLQVMGRVYAVCAMSQTFYRKALWRQTGCSSLEDYILTLWEGNFLKRNTDKLLAHIWAWQHADIRDSEIYKGNSSMALQATTALTDHAQRY